MGSADAQVGEFTIENLGGHVESIGDFIPSTTAMVEEVLDPLAELGAQFHRRQAQEPCGRSQFPFGLAQGFRYLNYLRKHFYILHMIIREIL